MRATAVATPTGLAGSPQAIARKRGLCQAGDPQDFAADADRWPPLR